MSCIDESDIVAMLRGELPPERVEEVDAHLDACEVCRELVSTLAQSSWLVPRGTRAPLDPESTGGEVAQAAEALGRGDEIGRYVVLGPVGAGGMGIVYAAYDPELDRKIAIKLLRTDISESDGGGQSWILREAQALARLSNPNVVAVYDVGTFRDMVFVAMEFLTGATLDLWLNQQKRTWEEVVRVFLSAGRGLAAAHDAGLVHRDFKPKNVVVDESGQVKVVDFGLARQVSPVAAAEPADRQEALRANLTRTRSIAGTPAYMAPEQHAGADADPRSDQFSFCLALSEAVFGERPFGGDTEDELRAAKERGPVLDAGAGIVPTWLRRLLKKGLDADPAGRFASMDDLLAELSRDRGVWWRWGVAAASAGLVLCAALAVTWASGDDSKVCKGAERKLAGIWDVTQKKAIRKAFLATGKPFAGAVWASVARRLDEYSRRWVGDHTHACEATRLRKEQSVSALDLEMGCFDRRLQELRALARVLSKADAEVLAKATAAAHALTPSSQCLDIEALRMRRPLPSNPRKRIAIEKARDQIVEVAALQRAGKYREGLAQIRKIVGGAPGLGHKPLLAEAMLLWAELEEAGGDAAVARRKFYEAFWAAQASRHDRVAAKAAIGLIQVLGYWLDKVDRAEHWARHAAAAIERIGKAPVIEADYQSTLGGLYYTKGRYRRALTHLKRALELRRAALGPKHPEFALSLNDVGLALWMLGRLDESMKCLRSSLVLGERLNGQSHPEVAVTLNNLALVLHSRGNYVEALPLFERSIAIRKETMGPEHVNVATALSNSARSLHALGRFDEALERHRQALEIRVRARGPSGLSPALSLHNIGSVLADQGRYSEALVPLRRALKIRKARRRPNHPNTAYTLARVADVLRMIGRLDEAERPARRALAIAEKELGPKHANFATFPNVLGRILLVKGRFAEAAAQHRRALGSARAALEPGHPTIATSLVDLGRALLRQGKRAEAVAAIRDAVRMRSQRRGSPVQLADARFLLARALSRSVRRTEEAKREARAALASFRQAGRWFRKKASRVVAWLARGRRIAEKR